MGSSGPAYAPQGADGPTEWSEVDNLGRAEVTQSRAQRLKLFFRATAYAQDVDIVINSSKKIEQTK